MKNLFRIFLFPVIFYQINCECGKQHLGTGLIFNGDTSVRGQWPWLAPFFEIKESSENFICGSTLISNLHVVTAAHCIQPKEKDTPRQANKIKIYLGRYDFSDNRDRNFVTRIGSDIKIHPDWNAFSKKYDADIAIIKMIQSVNFNANIQPICLPSSIQNTINIVGTVVGYGFTENTQGIKIEKISKFLEIPTVSQEDCLFSHPTFHYVASTRTFCGGERNKIPCNGDSGGGFFLKNPQTSHYSLVGIVSSAILNGDRCDPDYYAIFTNVPKFTVWIKEYTGITSSKPVWYSYKETGNIKPDTVYQQEDYKAYVGRKWHEGKLIVGKFMPQHNRFFFGYFSNELFSEDGNFELLQIHGDYNWIPFTGTIPQNALEGGHEGIEKLLIGRKYYNNHYLLGKIVKNTKTIYVPYYGKEMSFTTEFDILVVE